MGRLARYANVSPSEFDAMMPADARALDRSVGELVKAEIDLKVKLAKLSMRGRA